LQPPDGIVEIRISTNKVLCARRYQELEWHGTCNRDGRCDACHSEIDFVDAWTRLAGGVLDRTADKSYRASFSNGRRCIIGRIAKPFFVRSADTGISVASTIKRAARHPERVAKLVLWNLCAGVDATSRDGAGGREAKILLDMLRLGVGR
jgi:hypothetical protein